MTRKLLSIICCLFLCTLSRAEQTEETSAVEETSGALPSCSQPLEELNHAIESIFTTGYTVYINCLSFNEEGSLYAGVVSGTSPSGLDIRYDLSCSQNSIIVATPSSLPVDTMMNIRGLSTTCLSCNTSLTNGSCTELCNNIISIPNNGGCERCYSGSSGPHCTLCIACTALNGEDCSLATECAAVCGPGPGPFIINHEEHNHCVCNGSRILSDYSAQGEEHVECEEGHEEMLLPGVCEADCNTRAGFDHNAETGICFPCGLEYCVQCTRDPNTCRECITDTVLYEGECYACPLAEVALEAIEQEEERVHEEQVNFARTIELAISLPIAVILIIVFFVGMSIFAHHRYPHVSFHGKKRHRKQPTLDPSLSPVPTDDEQPQLPPVSHVWRPRPTIVLR